jgi:hypothetical protein
MFVNQQSGFAFSNITDEDAATQAIAEILDWLVQHLHRFQVAAATSDTDPWWPQGRNGPFFNVGLRTWQDSRATWLTPTQTRCVFGALSEDLVLLLLTVECVSQPASPAASTCPSAL